MQEADKLDSNVLQLELEFFEGPLDLLLHLINQMEIDIYDIPIATITDQYLDYLHQMKTIKLDIASEYFVLAATLMRIKSEMLVPRNENQANLEEDFYDEEDPRKPLVDLLLEYKQIKEVVPKFEERSKDRAGYFGKDAADLSRYQKTIDIKDQGLSVLDLADIFQEILKRHHLETPNPTTIEPDEITVVDKMNDIRLIINASKQSKVLFSELIDVPNRRTVVITFLALLELIKDNRVLVKQETNEADISIYNNEMSIDETLEK